MPTVSKRTLARTTATVAALAATLAAVQSAPPADAATACLAGIAHRGNAYMGSATENSLLGFQESWATGIGTVETDIWFTTDNVPVIMHDPTVDRTTTGTGTVIDMSSTEFAALKLNDGQTPPTLDELLTMLRADPKRHALIELKRYLTGPQKTIMLAKLKGVESQVDVNGFKWEQQSLVDLHKADPALHTSLYVDSFLLPMPAGVQGENLMSETSAANVAAIHAQGGTVRLFSDSPTVWASAQAEGVDAVITNKAYKFQQACWAASK